jgi:hypothetical protein
VSSFLKKGSRFKKRENALKKNLKKRKKFKNKGKNNGSSLRQVD